MRQFRVLHQLQQSQVTRDYTGGQGRLCLAFKGASSSDTVRGVVEKEDGAQADAYYNSRS